MILEKKLSDDLVKVIEARHHDPFSVLGFQTDGDQTTVTVFLPDTQSALLNELLPLERIEGTDLFQWSGATKKLTLPYKIHRVSSDGSASQHFDTYAFPPQLSDFDLHLFSEVKHCHAYRFFGAHHHEVDGIKGVLFATWAPSAERISVVGEFNQWDGRCHPMRVRGGNGVWELFIPELTAGELYKFEIRNRDDGSLHAKMDPYAQQS